MSLMSEANAPRLRVIRVRGARTHNLQAIDVDIPVDALVAITGPSGAGKSSLAFDTIYAEAQRRYVEALSTAERRGLSRLPRPDVDLVEGLSAAIAVAQERTARSPRSTLGTVTEIADHLRLLYARVGEPHCPVCGERIRAETPTRIVDFVLALGEGARVQLLAPIIRKKQGDLSSELEALRKDGFARAFVDGQLVGLDETTALDEKSFPKPEHDLDVVIDRLVIKADGEATRARATDSIELALRTGKGRMIVLAETSAGIDRSWHSERFACEKDDVTFPEVTPALFSFNSPHGACPTCDGLGEKLTPTIARVVPDPRKTLREGAIVAWGAPTSVAHAVELKRAVTSLKVKPDVAFAELDEGTRRDLLEGSSLRAGRGGSVAYEGVFPWIARQLRAAAEEAEDEGALDAEHLGALCEPRPCATCKGARLRVEALAVTLHGKSIADVTAMNVPSARDFVRMLGDAHVRASDEHTAIFQPLLVGIDDRLRFLEEIGLRYLTIDRRFDSLSGGEAARARLSTQLASTLEGVLYILDEPTAGLHPIDVARLGEAVKKLRAHGSCVIVVDHDLQLLRAVDHVVDVGVGAGKKGGRLVAQGSVADVSSNPASVTGPWLSRAARMPKPERKRPDPSRMLQLRGASLHNLRGVDVDIPLGLLVAITGPSGSGKSSLVEGTLLPALRSRGAVLPSLRSIEGAASLEEFVSVDATPLGRTLRSTPASYVELMPRLRDWFATMPLAATRGYKASRFSTNVKGGRCEECRGQGVRRILMTFLPDVFVTCDACQGARFDRATLEVRYRGHSIADVLAMSVDDAHVLFEVVTPIRERLAALRAVGLGYLPLGQRATTLSGGEAQRVKLGRELARRGGPQTIVTLDEPTIGLHPSDVAVLLGSLTALRDQGSSVLVVEHDMALAACCDWVIDLGPGSGSDGGTIVASGTPEEVAKSASPTAPYLAAEL